MYLDDTSDFFTSDEVKVAYRNVKAHIPLKSKSDIDSRRPTDGEEQ